MTDHDALVRAVCENPDDDTPRLVYADFLEEAGDPARAAFVRAQVDRARTPDWEPLAVLCRHRERSWGAAGTPFRDTLPPLPDGWGISWHQRAFRRGFGWRAHVRSLHAWASLAPRLYEQAPVGEVDLNPPATLDDWRAFAAGEWVRNLRVVHLDGASPVEPIRALCDAPSATGITDIHFHRASSPGLPELIEDLMRAPLGRAVRGLHFRVGYNSLEYLIDALTPGGTGVERLSLDTMGLTPDLIERLSDRNGLSGLTELVLRENGSIGVAGARSLADGLRRQGASLRALVLAAARVGDAGVEEIAGCEGLAGVRRLNLGHNPLTARGVQALARSEPLAGVRALSLVQCTLDDAAVRPLTRARFWENLVELDLRGNPLTGASARDLISAPVPPDLTALLLDGSRVGEPAEAALREHFGERVVMEWGQDGPG